MGAGGVEGEGDLDLWVEGGSLGFAVVGAGVEYQAVIAAWQLGVGGEQGGDAPVGIGCAGAEYAPLVAVFAEQAHLDAGGRFAQGGVQYMGGDLAHFNRLFILRCRTLTLHFINACINTSLSAIYIAIDALQFVTLNLQ